jgi:DNA integrity scanning protein DisA with diadenylate cyclase activity
MINHQLPNLEEKVLTKGLETAETEISLDVRLALYEALKAIKQDFTQRQKNGSLNDPNQRCGDIVVLGYDPKYDRCVWPMHRNLVKDGLEYNLTLNPEKSRELLSNAATGTDGAVLIDSNGNLISTGFYLNGFSIGGTIKDNGLSEKGSLSEIFGFAKEVGTKHIAAKCVSYLMPEALVYTLCEETSEINIRIFHKGNIIVSTLYPEEVRGINVSYETTGSVTAEELAA